MIAIIDYGVGNLFSLKSSFAAIGQEAAVTGDAAKIAARAERVILPGVGAFADAYEKLCTSGLDEAVRRAVRSPASPLWASAWACSFCSRGAGSMAARGSACSPARWCGMEGGCSPGV